jgi:uncharacterized protein (TIGR02147 family)
MVIMEAVQPSSPIPSIFQYLDYRLFIKDFSGVKKRTNRHFSHRGLARRAGFNSPSLFIMILNGKRNMTSNSHEQKYFETLVSFNQADNIETKKFYYEQLLPIYKEEHGKKLKVDQYEYMSNWYGPVIREMIALPQFRENGKWISRRLKNLITPAEAKKTIQILLDLGLVMRSESGRLQLVDHTVTTSSVVRDLGAFQFHRQMLGLASRALTQDASQKREISGLTTSLSKKQFSKLKQYIQEFQNKVICEFGEPDGEQDQVYQFNFQLFQITDIEKQEASHA